MKYLRQLIRQIILEGTVKDEFEEAWYNTETERFSHQISLGNSEMGTFPRDAIDHGYQYRGEYDGDEIDELFSDKRDLKRLWNELVDENNLRSFWQGPKMKYFHSLSYYGSATNTVDTLQQGEYSDDDIRDLSIAAFLRDYKMAGNKDEMSTYGVYVPDKSLSVIDENPYQMNIGVLLKGRVTIATNNDAWTESRSKATKKDRQTHRSSGLPKRIMPNDSNINSLVFEEGDIKESRIGECVLDNWGIEAIVYNPKSRVGAMLGDVVRKLSKQYDIPWVTAQDALGAP